MLIACSLESGFTCRSLTQPEPFPFAVAPVPVMLVLNIGETMTLSDLSPTRMERARLKIFAFAQTRKGQPLGLIAYAG